VDESGKKMLRNLLLESKFLKIFPNYILSVAKGTLYFNRVDGTVSLRGKLEGPDFNISELLQLKPTF
jgi:hypothetical protein